MIYPLTERRILGYDRRHETSANHKASQSGESKSKYKNVNERRHGQERRQLKLDREKLLESITTKQSKSKWQHIKFIWEDILKPTLVPLVIGGASFYVTQKVNDQQIESAEIIANGQAQNATKIAEANRDHSTKIANAELETQRLMQMAKIFSNIINLLNQPPEKNKATEDTLKQLVKSLSVYGDEALPFLVQLRDEYEREHYAESTKTISETAKETIKEVLLLNQPVVKNDFIGKKEEPLNLPRREYIKYNLSGSKFKDVNLYGANFSYSSLQDVQIEDANLRKANFSNASLIRSKFKNTDIAETNFDHANLKGATFNQVDLSNANFEKAYLKGAKFKNCNKVAKFKNCNKVAKFKNCNIEKAKFSIDQLVQADKEPFKSLSIDQYSKLLMQHEESLTIIHENNAIYLNKVYEKLESLNLKDITELRATISKLQKSIAQKNSNYKQTILARLLSD